VENEPNGAISGSDPYGDQAFSPTAGYDTVTFDQMQHQARQRRFSAAGFTDNAEGFALEQGERHTIDGADACGLAAAAHAEMLGEVAGDQQRLRRAADIFSVGTRRGQRGAHSRTSMADLIPSLTRLKQIEVTKIAAPGSAQDSGAT